MSKYIDNKASLEVLGDLYKDASLLDQGDKYFFKVEDFTTDIQKAIFVAMNNLHETGEVHFTPDLLDNFFKNKPESAAVYDNVGGPQWIIDNLTTSSPDNFDYYYSVMKKMTLMRGYEAIGFDLSWLLDEDNILDAKKKQEQQETFDALSLEELNEVIQNRIDNVKETYIDASTSNESVAIGEVIDEVMESLQEKPEMGTPLYGKFMNTITRGARLGKFYLRSAASGNGKSRWMMADACKVACNEIYDVEQQKWVKNGVRQAALFISTELEYDELCTMAVSFLSGVNEAHILDNEYDALAQEKERVKKAWQVLKDSPLYVEIKMDFSLKDIENCIKRNLRVRHIQYVFFDYIHTSMKILEEISNRSGGVKLREDNVLFLLSSKLKEICDEYHVFIESSTQLNGRID